jgi:cyclic pyranopterin phosphate synthase
MLVDRFGRIHDSLRISVTDRCNIRCFYCMPDGPLEFLGPSRLLTFDQIDLIVQIMARMGVSKLRLTGGEPLMRPRLDELVERLSKISGIEEVALTTNGMLLDRWARKLCDAGLRRVNISLDTLDEGTFQRISRRPGIEQVLRGIDAAMEVGFEVRLNALAIRDVTEVEVVDLVRFARERGLRMRFIEYMPLDADRNWDRQRVLPGGEILQILQEHFGDLLPTPRPHPSQPAEDYQFADGRGGVGIIRPVTEPFCGTCNRLRLTAEGTLRNCLFSHQEWDLRSILDAPDVEAQLVARISACVAAKEPGHLISREGFQQPERAMYRIGG